MKDNPDEMRHHAAVETAAVIDLLDDEAIELFRPVEEHCKALAEYLKAKGMGRVQMTSTLLAIALSVCIED